MQRVEAYRVEIPIVATDEYSSELSRANRAIDSTENRVSDAARAQDRLTRSSQGVARSQDDVSRSTRSASRGVDGVGRSIDEADRSARRTTRTFESFGNRVAALRRARATVEIAVRDNATSTLNRVRGTWDGFRRDPAVRLTVFAVDRAASVLNGIRKAAFSIPTMISISVGVIAGSKIAGMAKDGISSAVSKGMHEELSTVTIGSMLRDEKMTERYMGFMKNLAQDSPVLDYGMMMDNSKHIIAQTKNVKQLEDSWRIIEKLQTLDPSQGTDGAAFALKEMYSGDAVSLVERFGFEKAWANEVKKMSIDKQLVEFEKQLAKMGIDDQTIRDVAGTMHAQINQIKETLEDGTRAFGAGIIKSTAPVMSKFNGWFETNIDKWERIKSTANQIGESVSKWTIDKLTKQASNIGKVLQLNDILDVLTGTQLSAVQEPNGNGVVPLHSGDTEPPPFEARFKVAWDMLSGNVKSYFNENIKPAISEWWDESGSEMAVDAGKSIGEGIIEGIKIGIKGGAQFLSTSYEELFSNISENPFSAESGKSLLTAGIATAGAGYLAKKLVYNPTRAAVGAGRSAVETGRRAREWWGNGSDGRQERRTRREASWQASNDRRVQRRLARGDNATIRRERRQERRQSQPGRRGLLSPAPSRGLSGVTNKIPFLRTGMAALSIGSASEEELPSTIGHVAGGLVGAKGGAMAGAAIGSIIPGVGTAIGAGVGGLIGGIGGSIGGEWIGEHWETIKSKATETTDWIGTKFSEAKETASNTLLNAEWWSGKWDSVKESAASTFFSASWWGEQAGLVWGTLDTTLFSGEWWTGKWDSVKGWTSTKIGEWDEIYDNVTSKIDETIFNSEWWSGKWTNTKEWAETTLDGFGSVWSNALSSAESTLFNSEWWGTKWGQVKSWASSAWDNIKSGFNIGYNASSGNVQGPPSPYGPPKPDRKYAKGGIARSPHIGLVGEAGVPEAMIPWDGSDRSKALWQQTGEALGMFGDTSAPSNGQSIQASNASNSGSLTLNIGDITIGQASDMSAEGILNLIMPALYEHIQAALAKK